MLKRFILHKLTRKTYYALGAVLLVLAFGIWLLNRSHNTQTIPSSSPNKTVKSSSSTNNPSTTTPSQAVASPKSSPSVSAAGSDLIAPSGGFVSNHRPGGGTSTTETSVCNTSPGATCYIQFTKYGEVKRLDSQVADSSGAIYWYWDVNSAGLDAGSWVITAIASLNGQSKTTTDTLALEVQ